MWTISPVSSLTLSTVSSMLRVRRGGGRSLGSYLGVSASDSSGWLIGTSGPGTSISIASLIMAS